MKWSLLTAVYFGLASAAWTQTSVITAVLNNLEQPRLSPGGWAQVYGSFPMGRRPEFSVTVGNLPASLSSVAVDAKRNRCFEIDIQVPTELPPGSASVVVTHIPDNDTSPPFSVNILAVDPVINADPFTAFVHTSGVAVTPTLPAAPGETITTFMSGLGATNPTVPTGTDPASFTPTASPVTVKVGGAAATVIFAGRYPVSPPSVSLAYQVSFMVPAGAAAGPAPVVVTTGGVNSNTQTLFIGTQPLPNPPRVSSVVSGATFSTMTPIAPNSFVTIYGTGFGTQDNLAAFPSTQVNGISVLFNGQPAPIFSLLASGGQINVLSPSDLPITGETVHGVAVSVVNQNGPSKATFITTDAAGPGMFLIPDPSTPARRNVAALIANTAWFVMPASQAAVFGLPACTGLSVTSRCGQPASRGDFIQLYGTGLGLATPNGDPEGIPLRTGQPAPANGDPFYATVAKPAITIGGRPAMVLFSGVAPGFAGLYQINFQIPRDAPTGDSVAITLAMPGSTVDAATLAIQ